MFSSDFKIISYTGRRYYSYDQTYTFGRNPVINPNSEYEEIALPSEMISLLFPNTSVAGNRWNLSTTTVKYDGSGYPTSYTWDIVRSHYNVWENRIKNQIIELNIKNFDGEKEYDITKKFKIVGVYFDNDNPDTLQYGYSIGVSGKLYSEIQSTIKDSKPNIFLELPNNKEQALMTFNEANKLGYIINVWNYQSDIDNYKVDEFIDIASKAGLYIFAVFAIGIIWTVVSIEIVDSKKEIGILRSIGLSSGRVASIFIFQCVTVIFLSYFLGVYGAYRLIPIYNSSIMDEFKQIILYIYSFTYRTPLYLGIFTIGMCIISTAFPLGKIMSHRIIDVINERDN